MGEATGGRGALFPSDACEDYPDLPNVNLPGKLFPDDVKLRTLWHKLNRSKKKISTGI